MGSLSQMTPQQQLVIQQVNHLTYFLNIYSFIQCWKSSMIFFRNLKLSLIFILRAGVQNFKDQAHIFRQNIRLRNRIDIPDVVNLLCFWRPTMFFLLKQFMQFLLKYKNRSFEFDINCGCLTKECFGILNISQFSVLFFLVMWGFSQGLKRSVFVNYDIFLCFSGSPAAGLTESLILGTVLGKQLLNLKSLKGQYSRESKIFFRGYCIGKSVLSVEKLIVFYILPSGWNISLAGQPGENCFVVCLIGQENVEVAKNLWSAKLFLSYWHIEEPCFPKSFVPKVKIKYVNRSILINMWWLPICYCCFISHLLPLNLYSPTRESRPVVFTFWFAAVLAWGLLYYQIVNIRMFSGD